VLLQKSVFEGWQLLLFSVFASDSWFVSVVNTTPPLQFRMPLHIWYWKITKKIDLSHVKIITDKVILIKSKLF